MAKKRNNSKLVSIIVIVVLLIVSALITDGVFGDGAGLFNMAGLRGQTVADGKMMVEFIDVGQGDCTLITDSEAVILIDGGEAGEAQNVINYLKNKNIEKIDCCIATHPHSDHIGSLAKVFEEFEIKDVIMPDVPEKIIPTTVTYERFLESLSENAENVYSAERGKTYTYGGMTLKILAPVADYDDLNNMSVVSKVTFGNTSVMITGDAETPSEEDMLDFKGTDYYADILKVGHHGSRTSTSEEWLTAVNPQCAVVSCGLDNDYGHPHKQLIKRLEKAEIEYYRTDLLGSIVFESDGKEFVMLTEAE